MKKKKILLPEKRYKKALSKELNLTLNLDEEKNLFTNNDRNVVIDSNELFDKERNQSDKYKIHGKIKMIFQNLYSGYTTYDYLRSKLYLIGDGSGEEYNGYLPYDEFAFIRYDISRKKPVVYSGNTLIGFNGYNLTELIDDEHKVITEISSPKYNWNIFLSYAYDQDKEYPMTYTLKNGNSINFVSGDGIPFKVIENDDRYVLISDVDHGINKGEFIILDEEIYYINSVGNEKYDSEKYVINIFKSQISSGITTFNNNIVLGKRCLDSTDTGRTTSSYYIYKNKTLTSVNDCIIDKIGFESSIWEDEKKLLYKNSRKVFDYFVVKNKMENILYDFKDPFILTGLTNNLGYIPTNVYVTIIFRNNNGYFNYPPKIGYDFNFHDDWIDKHFEGNSSEEPALSGVTIFSNSGITFNSGNELPVGSELIGDFIEYTPTEMKERTISSTFHKITNPVDIFNYGQINEQKYIGAKQNNPFGLFYQTHYKVELRTLSPYIETSKDPNIDNLPNNAKFIEEDQYWKWRDLYSHGYIDDENNGVNHPFLNDMHYVKKDINFYFRNEKLHNVKDNGINNFNNKNLLC